MILHLILCASFVPNGISENYISLKDHDFMGEDQRLMSLLSQRMVMFQDEASLINMNPEPTTLQPDIELIQAFHRINQTGIKNFSASERLDFINLVNGSRFEFDPEMRFVPPATQNHSKILSGNYRTEDFIRKVVSKNNSNITAERRSRMPYPNGSEWDANWRMIDAMNQHIYMVQRRLADIDLTIQKYESDIRFRVAYIYNRLTDWLKDLKTIYYAMIRWRDPTFRVAKQLYYYEHALRKNIDITYSVEYLIYLHSIYMAMMKEFIPDDVMEERKQMNEAKMRNQTGNLND